jgi:hypothetical protein
MYYFSTVMVNSGLSCAEWEPRSYLSSIHSLEVPSVLSDKLYKGFQKFKIVLIFWKEITEEEFNSYCSSFSFLER